MFKLFYVYQYAELVFDLTLVLMILVTYKNFDRFRELVKTRFKKSELIIAAIITPFIIPALIVTLYYLNVPWIFGVLINALLYVIETLLFVAIGMKKNKI